MRHCISQLRLVTATQEVASGLIAAIKYFVTVEKFHKVTSQDAEASQITSRIVGSETLQGAPQQVLALDRSFLLRKWEASRALGPLEAFWVAQGPAC